MTKAPSGGTPDRPEIGIAVVGLGYWGPNRIRVLQEAPGVKVTGLCDTDRSALDQMARRYPSADATPSFDDLLTDPRTEAVVIATPIFTHAALATKALEAGKHVFVEKPLAASSGEARQLLELARERGRLLACGHTFLHSPPVRMIKQLLDDEGLGELHYVSSSRVNLGPYRSDVSVIFDLGPHDFSILLYWLGRMPRSVSAIGRDVISPGVCDFAFVNAVFDTGLVANLELSWLAPSKLRRTVLVGSERMLVYEDGSPEPIRIYDSGIDYRDPETFGEYHLAYRTGDIVSPHVDTAEPIAVEMETFLAAVRGDRASQTDASLAVNVIEMVEAAEASVSNGGAAMSLASADERQVSSL
jgi:predicted dehydrogenase